MRTLKTVILIIMIWQTGILSPLIPGLTTTAEAAERQARYLVISDLKAAPNPFSPYSSYSFFGGEEGEGLRISFKVESQARFVWITGKIFNVRGNLVRTITELEPVYSEKRGPDGTGEAVEIILWWDGMSDHNRRAKNGRYIFHLKVSDSEAENFFQEKMTTFVMVK
jgi:hypothetical protein